MIMRPLLAVVVSFLLFLLMACGVSKSVLNGVQSEAIKALPATDFLNSLGVNSAVSKRGESLTKTAEAGRYLGIRWIRSGYEGNLPVEDLVALHQRTGIKFSYGLLSGGSDIARLLAGARQLASAGALLALEGPNEPNNWAVTYQGERGGANGSWMAVARLQRDLYRAVKSDPVLMHYPVWSISENGAQTDNTGLQFLTIPKSAGALMPSGTRYADAANGHNYFMHPSHPGLYDNQTWNAADPTPACKVDGLYGNYGSTWRSHFRGYSPGELTSLPRVTTETGATIGGALTEEKQARLYLNLYLAQFKRGWRYTAVYLLRDRSDESGNQQFGFYKPDYTPRKAALYLHYFTRILADTGKGGQGGLYYSIPDQPETVHDLLLQKSNGTFCLLLWDEKAAGGDRVQVNLGTTYKSVPVYDPTVGVSPVRTFRNAHVLSLSLTDHPVVIMLSRNG